MKLSIKVLSLILLVVLVFSFSACSKQKNKENNGLTIRVAALKGPTAIGMVKLMDDSDKNLTKNSYSFNIYATADMVTPLLVKGEIDIAAVPVNLASVLYNKTNGDIQMLAINTLNVLYIVSSNEDFISESKTNLKEALKGKTIYATGKGSTPEYTLKELLMSEQLNPETDVEIVFKSEATEIVAVLKNDTNAIAMLPQPYVTVAQNTISTLKIAVDIGDNLNSKVSTNMEQVVTGSIIVRSEFAKNNPDAVKTFLKEYAASTDYVINNVPEAAKLVDKFDLFKEAIAVKAIPYCSITCITGEKMKGTANYYLNKLYDENSSAVGGKVPGDDFYYIVKE